jgi:UTP--glucose-1-phosphate uridylyltransferase
MNSDCAYAYKLEGTRYDVGDKLGYINAMINFGLENESLKDALIEYLKIRVVT